MQYICAVYDVKMGQYNTPLSFPTKGVALRSFADQCANQSPENAFRLHPEDYLFFHLGEYNEETGQLVSYAPQQIAHAVDYVNV